MQRSGRHFTVDLGKRPVVLRRWNRFPNRLSAAVRGIAERAGAPNQLAELILT
jgi:hypothetical protein